MSASRLLPAPRILIVEDEALLALELETTLEDLGWEVAGSLSGVQQALTWLADRHRDPAAAVLDVNLGGEMVFPVAEALARRQIPFAFATGYADLISRSPFAGTPTLTKPVQKERLRKTLQSLLGVQ